jgi:hypothetical protein
MQMTTTSWMGEGPDGGPGLPVTEMLLARRERRAGPLETALARSRAAEAREAREAAAFAPDPDERAAGLVARGYSPGLASQLAQRLADTTAEIEAEEAKIGQSARRQERIARDHAAGRITAFDIARMQAGDDEGDPAAVERLRRRADGLRKQIRETMEMIAPPQQRETDPVAAAATRARSALAEVTRSQVAGARERSRPQERPPFDSVSRGRSTEHVPDGYCWVCAEGRRMAAARDSEDGAAGKLPPYSEFGGPAIIRDGGYVVSVR